MQPPRSSSAEPGDSNDPAAAIAAYVSQADPTWVPVVEIANFEDTGRGMRAIRDISPGDTIIRIPESLLITATQVYRHFPGFKKRPPLDEHCVLALFLYVLSSDKAVHARLGCHLDDFQAYKDSLPQSFDTMYYSAEEVTGSPFVPSHVQDKLATQRALIQSHSTLAASLLTKLDPLHAFDEPAFLQAWFACNTRCVSLPPGSQHSMALAPLLDMFNHSNLAQVKMTLSNGFYSLVTLNPWRAGNQVFIHYGDHDNWSLWIEYGFCLPNNTRALSLLDDLHRTFPPSDPVYARRWDLLAGMGLVNDQALSLPASFALRCALHLLLMPKRANDDKALAKWTNMYYSGTVAEVADEGKFVGAYLQRVKETKRALVEKLMAGGDVHPNLALILSDAVRLLDMEDVDD